MKGWENKMKSLFKVKDANKTVRDVFLNGMKQTQDYDFKLNKDSIKVLGDTLKKGEIFTFTQETTIIV